jgi:hypothetical protein
MNPRVQAVQPQGDYILLLKFTSDEVRIFDMKPYLDKGIFRELRECGYFNAVRVCLVALHGRMVKTCALTRCMRKASLC